MLVEDRLFATLDPTTRRLALPGGEPVLLTDTVGFVRRLPHGLVEAFKSTLEVVAEADLLVHVVDASAADPEAQIDAVHAVLAEIGADRVPELIVFNKSDLAPEEAVRLVKLHPGSVAISAVDRPRHRRPADRGVGPPACARHRHRAARPVRPGRRPRRHPSGGRGPLDRARRCRRPGAGPPQPALGRAVGRVRGRRWRPARTGHHAGRLMASGTGARRTEGPTSPSGTGARRTEGPTSPSGAGARRTEGPTSPSGFVPPPYPYDRLGALAEIASTQPGGVVDLSIGTPCDPPPAAVVRALSSSDSERGYPPSIGTPELRSAVRRWLDRRFGVDVPIAQIAACVGTKEFVGTLPQWLRLRSPDRDTVLYPAVSYPTYAMGAILAGCRPVAVPTDARFRLRLDAIDPDDAARALVLWVNSPGNPTGALDDLGAAAAWGRARGIPVFSDECYCEFTWDGPPRTILEHGLDGVVAVHSLSKRSNLAGLRVGFYAGDGELVAYLQEVRKHVGLLVPGPAQAAGVVALDDDGHVEEQRQRYRERLELMAGALSKWAGLDIDLPSGGFYLWFPAGDGWDFTERVARAGGALVSPGEFYGTEGADHVRVAVVQPLDRLNLVVERLGVT